MADIEKKAEGDSTMTLIWQWCRQAPGTAFLVFLVLVYVSDWATVTYLDGFRMFEPVTTFVGQVWWLMLLVLIVVVILSRWLPWLRRFVPFGTIGMERINALDGPAKLGLIGPSTDPEVLRVWKRKCSTKRDRATGDLVTRIDAQLLNQADPDDLRKRADQACPAARAERAEVELDKARYEWVITWTNRAEHDPLEGTRHTDFDAPSGWIE